MICVFQGCENLKDLMQDLGLMYFTVILANVRIHNNASVVMDTGSQRHDKETEYFNGLKTRLR